jgi:hypothetical protein
VQHQDAVGAQHGRTVPVRSHLQRGQRTGVANQLDQRAVGIPAAQAAVGGRGQQGAVVAEERDPGQPSGVHDRRQFLAAVQIEPPQDSLRVEAGTEVAAAIDCEARQTVFVPIELVLHRAAAQVPAHDQLGVVAAQHAAAVGADRRPVGDAVVHDGLPNLAVQAERRVQGRVGVFAGGPFGALDREQQRQRWRFGCQIDRLGAQAVADGGAQSRAGNVVLPQRGAEAEHQGQYDRHAARGNRAVTAAELAQPVAKTRRASQHRFVAQVAFEILRELGDGLVSVGGIALQRLQRDPIEVAAQPSPQSVHGQASGCGDGGLEAGGGCTRPRRIHFAHLLQVLQQPSFLHRAGIVRQTPRQQFVEQHAERIDIGANVNLAASEVRLLGTHVTRRAEAAAPKRHRFARSRVAKAAIAQGLGDAKVDDLRHRRAIDGCDQHVARLQVAVNDSPLVRVVHAAADLDEQPQAAGQWHPASIAERHQRSAADELHREEWQPLRSGPGVVDLRDIRMAHARQRLPLEREAGDHLRRVHAGAQNLQAPPGGARVRAVRRGAQCRTHLRRAATAAGSGRSTADPRWGIRWCRGRAPRAGSAPRP